MLNKTKQFENNTCIKIAFKSLKILQNHNIDFLHTNKNIEILENLTVNDKFGISENRLPLSGSKDNGNKGFYRVL